MRVFVFSWYQMKPWALILCVWIYLIPFLGNALWGWQWWNQSYLCRYSLSVVVETSWLVARFYCCPLDFCNYQPKWACRFCFHFVGLTTAFFAFYTPIWVGISLASIAVESVATFQILGKKINPVTKMSRFTRPFGLGVLAGRVEKEIVPSKQNKRKDRRKTRSKADEVQIENRVAHIITVHCYEYT